MTEHSGPLLLPATSSVRVVLYLSGGHHFVARRALKTTAKTADATVIRPFTIETPEADLDDLRAWIAATRWPERRPSRISPGRAAGDDAGARALLGRLVRLRKCEARLNAYPQFITEIDGLDIHFVHVRSKHEDALPLIVATDDPFFIEQLKIVDLLTDPTAHGGSASDAFHVVIPNIPGYGFSGKPTTTGWGPDRIGRAWVELMKCFGYERFVAAGGEWGGIAVDVMAGGRDAPASPEPAPPELLGIHTTFAGVVPPAIDKAIQTGAALPSDLSTNDARPSCWRAPTTTRPRARWRGTHRRCSDWLTHPSPWRPGWSTTTRSATRH